MPRSRHSPQFNRSQLSPALHSGGVLYFGRSRLGPLGHAVARGPVAGPFNARCSASGRTRDSARLRN
ncbi:MAG: hypothetical protein ABSF12_15070 [Bryobacteraceae bacterium]